MFLETQEQKISYRATSRSPAVKMGLKQEKLDLGQVRSLEKLQEESFKKLHRKSRKRSHCEDSREVSTSSFLKQSVYSY